uniref:hypothetical protein n=1 Tax=Spirosoma sp. TaxID=1899569 RepID=UPI003B3A2E44
MENNILFTIYDLVKCVVINARRKPGEEVCQYISLVIVHIDRDKRFFYEEVINGVIIVVKEILRDTRK